MKRNVSAALVAIALLVTTGGLASAAPTPPRAGDSGSSGRGQGDWASHGCVWTTWDNGSSFWAWALDTYSSRYDATAGLWTQDGTFTAYCDPMHAQPNETFAVPVQGTLHGWIQYNNDGSMADGLLTYSVPSQGWTYTQSGTTFTEWESQQLVSGKAPAGNRQDIN